MFYDKNEQVSKRISPMTSIASVRNPHVFVSYLKNGKVTKEAVYLQPEGGRINGDYTQSEVLNIAKYGKSVFETGKIGSGNQPGYVFIDNKPYLIYSANTAEQTNLSNCFINHRRQITFNKNNQIITRKEALVLEGGRPGNKYSAIDSKTGQELYTLTDKDGYVEAYTATDLYTQKPIIRVLYEIGGEPECYTVVPFENGKSMKDQIQIIHKSSFDTEPLYEPFKADYAPDRIMEPNR
jgi:hypothetical protein